MHSLFPVAIGRVLARRSTFFVFGRRVILGSHPRIELDLLETHEPESKHDGRSSKASMYHNGNCEFTWFMFPNGP